MRGLKEIVTLSNSQICLRRNQLHLDVKFQDVEARHKAKLILAHLATKRRLVNSKIRMRAPSKNLIKAIACHHALTSLNIPNNNLEARMISQANHPQAVKALKRMNTTFWITKIIIPSPV